MVNSDDSTADAVATHVSLSVRVGEFMRAKDPWQTLARIDSLPDRERRTLAVRGLREIVRNVIVRDLLAGEERMSAVPRLTPDFVEDFERFDLTVRDGYLVSLIDGRSSIQSILKLSPVDPFTTLFAIARLHHKKVVTLPS